MLFQFQFALPKLIPPPCALCYAFLQCYCYNTLCTLLSLNRTSSLIFPDLFIAQRWFLSSTLHSHGFPVPFHTRSNSVLSQFDGAFPWISCSVPYAFRFSDFSVRQCIPMDPLRGRHSTTPWRYRPLRGRHRGA